MGIKEIKVEIQKLALKDRATLAKWMGESLEDQSEADVLWADEAERRLGLLINGKIEALDGKSVVDSLRMGLK